MNRVAPIVCIALSGYSYAQMVHVSPSGANSGSCGSASNPCLTIQYAVTNIAASGDTVYLMNGTYSLSSSSSAGSPIVNLKQDANMTFLGDTNGTATLNGLHHNKAFQYDYYSFCPNSSGTNNNTVFALHLNFLNLRIINGFTPQFTCGSTTYALGGGIMLRNDPASKLFVNIRDCEFVNCEASDSVGPNNHGRSVSGGAIYIDGRSVANASDSSLVRIHNCSFLDNRAVQLPNGGHGGAVCLVNVSKTWVTNSSFCSNYTFGIQADNGDLQYDRNAGGALLFYDQYNTNPGHQYVVDSCTFIDNSATTTGGANFTYHSEGGGIFLTRGDNLSGVCNASLSISNSQFTGNYVENATEHYDNNSGNVSVSNNILSTGSSIQLLGNDTFFCAGDSMTFSVMASGFDILWSDSSTGSSVTVYDSDTLWVSVSNGGCNFTDTVIVMRVEPIFPPAMNDTTICPNGVIIAGLSNDYGNILWNDGWIYNSRFITDVGTYFYSATDINGCTVGDTFTLSKFTEPGFLSQRDTSLCNVDTLEWCMVDHDGLSFTAWSSGDTNQCRSFTSNGTYLFEYENESGCAWTDSVSIQFSHTDDAYLEESVTCCKDSCEPINPTYFILNPQWSNGDTNRTFLPSASGSYTVEHGSPECRIFETIVFTIFPCDTADTIIDPIDTLPNDSNLGIDSIPEIPCDTLVTNVFTPNGDGINEHFRPWDPACEDLIEMRIYNRWGITIRVLDQTIDQGWDGTNDSGRTSEEGVYFYALWVEAKGEPIEKRGSLTLLRH